VANLKMADARQIHKLKMAEKENYKTKKLPKGLFFILAG